MHAPIGDAESLGHAGVLLYPPSGCAGVRGGEGAKSLVPQGNLLRTGPLVDDRETDCATGDSRKTCP